MILVTAVCTDVRIVAAMTHPQSLCYRLAPEGGGWVDIDLQRWAAFSGGDGAFPEHAGSAQVFALVEVIEEAGRLYAADLATLMIELDDAGRARGRPTTLTPLDLVDCGSGLEEAELAADTSADGDPLRERWSTLRLVATLQLRAGVIRPALLSPGLKRAVPFPIVNANCSSMWLNGWT